MQALIDTWNTLWSTIFPDTLIFIAALAPIWIPITLWGVFWTKWVRYVRTDFISSQKYIVLEIKIPKEISKSPLAMELFLTALHQTSGEGNWYDRFWLGKVRAWFSLEMVSVEGKVAFYIWTRENLRNFIESSLYAQFPGIEVHEKQDYALGTQYDQSSMKAWVCELQLTKEDPYPIKTYLDYGLDKDPKEEFKVDPIVPLLEFLGSVGANQQVWFQIVMRAHKAESRKLGTFFKTEDKWKEEAKAEVNKILRRDAKTLVAGEKTDEGRLMVPKITKGEEDIVASLERSVTKFPYDVGIRCMYIAHKDNFNPAVISGVTGSWKQFGSEHLNGFKPNSAVYSPSFSYPWQDFRDKRKTKAIKNALDCYKRRAFFFGPTEDDSKTFVLNSEELATIYHFPGSVAATPSLNRVESRKSEAPANLPF